MPTTKTNRTETEWSWQGAGLESRFRRSLLQWFTKHQRELPWRGNYSAYRVWVSEIMLQQTQVATVTGYFDRFVRRFPTVQSLARADVSEVLKLWEGLGYYRRARQLHAAAREVVEKWNGRFPRSVPDAISLPGVGRYTAGAILSIAFDQPHPILEGNTIRLFARLQGISSNVRDKSVERQLWGFSERLLPSGRGAREINQALMELGSEICRVRNPLCSDCPVRNYCRAFSEGSQHEIPVMSRRMTYEKRRVALLILQKGSRYLLRKCTDDEHWTGLWDFPRFVVDNRTAAGVIKSKGGATARLTTDLCARLKTDFGLSANLIPTGKRINHAVTKYRITLDCYRGEDVAGRLLPGKNCAWVAQYELERLPLNSTGRKIANWVAAKSI